MKKPTIKRLKTLADKAYQTHCGRFCEVCGGRAVCLHHFVPKSVCNRLRYDLKNGISICAGCHMRHHQAGDPMIHITITKKRGVKWLGYIKKARYETIKVDRAFYEEAIKKLENEKNN